MPVEPESPLVELVEELVVRSEEFAVGQVDSEKIIAQTNIRNLFTY